MKKSIIIKCNLKTKIKRKANTENNNDDLPSFPGSEFFVERGKKEVISFQSNIARKHFCLYSMIFLYLLDKI